MLGRRFLFFFMLAALPGMLEAQVVGVALDSKAVMVDGEVKLLPLADSDSAVFFQFSDANVRKIGEVAVPTSFQGPPSAVAVSADRTLALVSASSRIDSKSPNELVPDNKLSVVDLTSKPISVVQMIELGASPSSVAMNPAGTMALAMHSSDDSVSVLTIANSQVRVVDKLPLGKGTAPIAAAFGPGGDTVLISFPNLGKIGLFAVEGNRLKVPAIREMSAGIYPTALSYCGNSGFAVVSNYGKVTGDADTVSLIDINTTTPRVVDTATVGPAPEGVACSPDGRYVAAAVQNMSTTPKSNPFHMANSKVVVLKIDGKRLLHVAEAPIGGWAQGVGFLDDSRTLFAQSMMDRSMHLFRIEDNLLKAAAPPIAFKEGAPVSFGISGR